MIKHEEMKKELDTIYNKPFDILKLDNAPLSAVPQFANFLKKIYQYITEQEKKDELLENVKDILALNYSYQEIGIKISKLFKQLEEELK